MQCQFYKLKLYLYWLFLLKELRSIKLDLKAIPISYYLLKKKIGTFDHHKMPITSSLVYFCSSNLNQNCSKSINDRIKLISLSKFNENTHVYSALRRRINCVLQFSYVYTAKRLCAFVVMAGSSYIACYCVLCQID